MKALLLALILNVWPSGFAYAAEITGYPGELEYSDGRVHPTGEIVLLGEIVEGDSKTFNNIIKEANLNGHTISSVTLFSTGGSLAEAIKIGRLVRRYRLSTISPNEKMTKVTRRLEDGACYTAGTISGRKIRASDPNCICASACGLIWLSGILRDGDIWLHHSYLGQSTQSTDFSSMSMKLDLARRQTAEFLEEMRVPRFVEDIALTTESANLEMVSSADDRLRIDPVINEYLEFHCPYSLTVEEREKRRDLLSKSINVGLQDVERKLLDQLAERLSPTTNCRRDKVIDMRLEIQSKEALAEEN